MRHLQERGVVVPALTPGFEAGRAGPAPSAGGAARRPRLVAAVAAAVLLVDQVTKSVALDALADGPVHLVWTLRLRLSFNRGAAFGVGPGLTPLLTAAAAVLVVVLVVMGRRSTTRLTAVAIGLLLGGAAGNLGDRLLRDHAGAVVDFIDLQWWPVFNVADSAITLGAALMVLGSLRPADGGPQPAGG